MKRAWILLLVFVTLGAFSEVANSSLTTIGTAKIGTEDYKLIYEDDQKLIWLDRTITIAFWNSLVSNVSGLNTPWKIEYTLNPGISISWRGDWRLPSTMDGPYVLGNDGTTTAGFNITNSEMGHLFYLSLGNNGYYNTSGVRQTPYGLQNTGPFDNLFGQQYFSGTEYSLDPTKVWIFNFGSGNQALAGKEALLSSGLAVRLGEVVFAPVPIPAAAWLLGTGLIGLVAIRRKLK